MSYRSLAAITALLFALPAAAQIYRCETDGVAAFSDRPCGPDAIQHSGGYGVSFVTPDENLPALAESARAFIRKRRERLARERRPAPPYRAQSAAGQPATRTVYVPWPVIDRKRHGGHRRDRQPLPSPAPGRGEDKGAFSPLSGPILGTRRDLWLFDDAPQRHAGENRP